MKRLIFCPGTCQVLMAVSALAQHRKMAGTDAAADDTLVVYTRKPNTPYADMIEKVARSIWSWTAICWAYDAIVWYGPVRPYAPTARARLNEWAGPEVDEIWISKLYMDSSKLILYAYPRARVVLYEDGAEDYIPQEVLCGGRRLRALPPSRWPGALKRESSHWNRRPECMEGLGVCARDLRRVDVFYTLLSRYLGRPDYLSGVREVEIDVGVLRGQYEKLSAADGAPRCPRPLADVRGGLVLFLPQPFATIYLSEEDEYAMYYSAVKTLRDKGYRLLWKEHPREASSLVSRLQEDLGATCVEPVRVLQYWPVESLVAGWKLDAVVSVNSVSLLLLHALYGYPFFTFANHIAPEKWRIPNERALSQLFLDKVPTIDDMPAVRDS